MINHIAFIMDGNRRYSEKNKISMKEGYRKGMEKFLEFVNYQVLYKIKETTFFALSSDNYQKRPEKEKNILAELCEFFSKNEQIEEYFLSNNVLINIRGDLETVKKNEKNKSGRLINAIKALEKKLEEYNEKIKKPSFRVNICINYDGQEEIVNSVKKIIKKIQNEPKKLFKISAKTIKENLYVSNSPAPEVIVRTGNAPRLSGFLLWDSAYSEIYFTNKLWPELNRGDFESILSWYSNLNRNFGK